MKDRLFSNPFEYQDMLTGPIILGYIGRYDQAIPLLEKAIRLNPVSPISYLTTLAFAYTNKKEYDKAIRLWQEALRRDSDNYYAHIILTAIYQLIGEEKKATQFAEKTIRIKPEISISMLKKRVVMTDEEALNLLLRCTSRRWHPL